MKQIKLRLREESDIGKCIDALMNVDLDEPRQMIIQNAEGRRRSVQNALMWMWNTYVASQTGESKETVHSRCKLTIGVPILAANDPVFGQTIEKALEGLTYPERFKIIERMDVTSLMTVSEFSQYLKDYEETHADAGIPLPHPEDRYYEALGYVHG